ncbi:hypothetical protein F4780DRAFT_742690 [Xylariomycetidae sp. FL0641]|nr:hypothetical protein F4780DRAFT_742690 [Xylariomycetidae sp. FL0641]
MEPLVTLGLVGNVFQVACFGGQLLKAAYKIHRSKSDELRDYAHIASVTRKMDNLVSVLELHELRNSARPLRRESLSPFVQEYRSASADLLLLLDGTMVKTKSKREALRLAWCISRQRAEKERRHRRLTEAFEWLKLHEDWTSKFDTTSHSTECWASSMLRNGQPFQSPPSPELAGHGSAQQTSNHQPDQYMQLGVYQERLEEFVDQEESMVKDVDGL